MTEPVFLQAANGLTAQEIAALTGASLLPGAPGERRVSGIGPLDRAGVTGHGIPGIPAGIPLGVGSGDNAVEQLLQADLAERGVRMEIRQVEMGSFLTTARARDKRFDALITGFPGDLSLAYLGAMFDSRQAGSSLDYADFHTRELDTLFAVARDVEVDHHRRKGHHLLPVSCDQTSFVRGFLAAP